MSRIIALYTVSVVSTQLQQRHLSRTLSVSDALVWTLLYVFVALGLTVFYTDDWLAHHRLSVLLSPIPLLGCARGADSALHKFLSIRQGVVLKDNTRTPKTAGLHWVLLGELGVFVLIGTAVSVIRLVTTANMTVLSRIAISCLSGAALLGAWLAARWTYREFQRGRFEKMIGEPIFCKDKETSDTGSKSWFSILMGLYLIVMGVLGIQTSGNLALGIISVVFGSTSVFSGWYKPQK